MITATIVGDQEAIIKLGALRGLFHEESRKAVELMALKTLVRVKNKLSDDVLKVRTGRLRRSINQKVEDNADGSIVGTVGTNVEYGRFQELGFSGTEGVREHLRTIKKAFGKTIKGGAVTFTVSAHSRQVNYPAHSFLASALAELAPEFKRDMAGVAEKVIHK